jgi:glycosyltransferase involved in cell wall biosynthesis
VEASDARLGLGSRVKYTGYMPDSDLPGVYSGALIFCYPSLYEGFGLPPLEAMSCGTPTVTSNVSSLPEVVGDAAITVDPTSVASIASALRQLAESRAARDEYAARGIERAARFTWERTAQLTREVYDAVLGVRRPLS